LNNFVISFSNAGLHEDARSWQTPVAEFYVLTQGFRSDEKRSARGKMKNLNNTAATQGDEARYYFC